MTQTLSRPETAPQPKGPDNGVERQPGKFGRAMQKIGHNVLKLVSREATPKQERRVGSITSGLTGVVLLATAATGGIAAAQAPEHQGVTQEQVDPGSGVDTGVDTGNDGGVDQAPDTIPSLEQTPEQLEAPFLIPADTKPEDFPAVFVQKLELLSNGGANPVDVPAQNWDPNDPHLAQVAEKVTAAGQGALFADGEPVYSNNQLAGTLYYYGKTSYEEQIYPGTEPYKISLSLLNKVVTDNGDGTYTYTLSVRNTDNSLKNSVQNQRKQQGDSNGTYDETSEYTFTTKGNGASIEVYDFHEKITSPDVK